MQRCGYSFEGINPSVPHVPRSDDCSYLFRPASAVVAVAIGGIEEANGVACAGAGGALFEEPRVPTSSGAGKGDGRGAEGVGPSHRE